MNRPSVDRVREVFEQWELYDAIIRHNYMHHLDLPPRLHAVLSRLDAPLSVLDLGCGDGSIARGILGDLPIETYEGVDLSAEALQRLDARTVAWDGCKTLHQGDFSQVLPVLPSARFDVVLANYSLHHFSQAQKSTILGEICRVLRPAGLFVWTDVVLEEGEDRQRYLQRLERVMRDWSNLTPAQIERGIEHIWDSDFPETFSWMESQLSRLGWDVSQEILRDETFGSWVFRRTQ